MACFESIKQASIFCDKTIDFLVFSLGFMTWQEVVILTNVKRKRKNKVLLMKIKDLMKTFRVS